jgi:hypothetical protein
MLRGEDSETPSALTHFPKPWHRGGGGNAATTFAEPQAALAFDFATWEAIASISAGDRQS